ncbi:MAG: RpiB/LacA/LacB family sugar-phosphate isomerase [Alphaproteobacteria bacterium]
MTLQRKKIYIACDHAAYELKNFLHEQMKNEYSDLEIIDFGVDDNSSVDYPDQAEKVTSALKDEGDEAFGLLLCGTGIGISIAANRHPWIRAALVHTTFEAEVTRRHNNANVIAFGGRTLGTDAAWHALKGFLTTDFEGGRHARRIAKL